MTITDKICVRIVDDVDWLFKKIFPILFLILFFVLTATAQTDCPSGMVCISQEAANKAAENARVRPELENKVKVLEEALVLEKQNTADVRLTAAKNEADLRAALHKTEMELALERGKVIGLEANAVENRAIITAFLPMIRKKCNAAIVLFC